ncbi:hypothetical protein BT93_H0126 [Corymbia citriodora subsp. variegata]|nr:hypothetical protein BT93_H0126 [Corymbia citriodora subsp. variegata]
MDWVLLATPVVLVIIVHWLSFAAPPHHRPVVEGSSPLGVAIFVVLMVILVQYQPAAFLEKLGLLVIFYFVIFFST